MSQCRICLALTPRSRFCNDCGRSYDAALKLSEGSVFDALEWAAKRAHEIRDADIQRVRAEGAREERVRFVAMLRRWADRADLRELHDWCIARATEMDSEDDSSIEMDAADDAALASSTSATGTTNGGVP